MELDDCWRHARVFSRSRAQMLFNGGSSGSQLAPPCDGTAKLLLRKCCFWWLKILLAALLISTALRADVRRYSSPVISGTSRPDMAVNLLTQHAWFSALLISLPLAVLSARTPKLCVHGVFYFYLTMLILPLFSSFKMLCSR